MLKRLSTAGLPLTAQFQAWQEVIWREFDATPLHDLAQGYALEHVAFECGPLKLQHYRRDAGLNVRDARHVRATGGDWLRVQVNVRGTTDYIIGDDSFTTVPGGVTVRDMAQPGSARGYGTEVICFDVSRDQLARVAPRAGRVPGHIAPSVMTSLFGDHVAAIMSRASEITADTAGPIFDAASHMFAALLSPTPNNLEAARNDLDASLLRKAKAFVASQLASLDLSPDVVAKNTGVSRRKLYLLFEPEGGVRRYIQAQRLESARDALRRDVDVRVKAVAFDHGFTSEAHFREASGHCSATAPAKLARRRAGLTKRRSWPQAKV